MYQLLVIGLLLSTDSTATNTTTTEPKLAVSSLIKEEKIAFDDKSKTFEITAQDANKLGIFQDIQDFTKAEVYKTSPSDYSLDIYYKENEKLFRLRKNISDTEFKSLQVRIDSFITAHPKLDRSGRGLFILGSFQSAFTEWSALMAQIVRENTNNEMDNSGKDSLGDTTFNEGSKLTAVAPLLTAAGGFFIPLMLTRNKPITLGQASLSWSWTQQGYGVGFLVSDLVGHSIVADSGTGNANYSSKIYPTAALIGGISGDLAGYLFGEKSKISEGKAAMVAEMGYWGAAYSALVSFLVIPWKDGYRNYGNSGGNLKLAELATLGGLGCGEYLWYKRAKDVYTYGDFLGFSTFSGLSVFTSLNIVSYIVKDPNTEGKSKLFLGTAGAINLLGLWKGANIFVKPELTFIDGVTALGGTAAGLLLGGGVALLVDPEDGRFASSMMLAGSWTGYLVTQKFIGQGSKAEDSSTGFKLELQPENLLGLLMSREKHTSFSAPLFTVRF